MTLHPFLAAGVASVSYTATLTAQASAIPATDLFSGISLTAAAAALIAWGAQREKVHGHGRRLVALEDDRVTRAEFETMGGNIRNIESDMRQVREMLERRRSTRSSE